jgi:hypothetical protein
MRLDLNKSQIAKYLLMEIIPYVTSGRNDDIFSVLWDDTKIEELEWLV